MLSHKHEPRNNVYSESLLTTKKYVVKTWLFHYYGKLVLRMNILIFLAVGCLTLAPTFCHGENKEFIGSLRANAQDKRVGERSLGVTPKSLYAQLGQSCSSSIFGMQCNPEEAFCSFSENCKDPRKSSGVCASLLGSCESDAGCRQNEFCDEVVSRCNPKLQEGDCCSLNNDLCADGHYCSLSVELGPICKAYVSLYSPCGGRTLQGEGNRCNPQKSYCFYTNYCQRSDLPGVCFSLFGNCQTDKDCKADHFCDMGEQPPRCKQRLLEGVCCDASKNQCLPGLSCKEAKSKLETGFRCWPWSVAKKLAAKYEKMLIWRFGLAPCWIKFRVNFCWWKVEWSKVFNQNDPI